LTQQELAVRAKVDVDVLRRIERGVIIQPNFFVVADLARAAGFDLATLGSRTRSPRSSS
jgi:ribosome-binding protein aMBF1 (putative translation factor)